MSSTETMLVWIEHVIWHPGDDWDAAVRALAERFSRAMPLDDEEVRSAGALHHQVDHLQRWAGRASVDLNRELGRWMDEHAARFVRPDPRVTRALRALVAAGCSVDLVSALPPRAAEAIAHHAGCRRSARQVHGLVTTSDDAAALEHLVQCSIVVAALPTPIPAEVAPITLHEATMARAANTSHHRGQ